MVRKERWMRAALAASAVQVATLGAFAILARLGVRLNFHSPNGFFGDTIMTVLVIGSLPGSLVVLGVTDSWPDWASTALMVAVNLVTWTAVCYFAIRVAQNWRAESGRNFR